MFTKDTLDKILSTFGPCIIDWGWKGGNTPFIRFGYWRQVNSNLLQETIGNQFTVVEDEYDEDGCLTRYSYKLIERK